MFSDRVGRLVSGRSVATLCKNVASKLSMCVYVYISWFNVARLECHFPFRVRVLTPSQLSKSLDWKSKYLYRKQF